MANGESEKKAGELLAMCLALTARPDLEGVAVAVVEQAQRMIGAEAATVWLFDETGEELVPVAARGPKAELLKDLRLRRSEGLAGRVAETGEAVLVEDVTRDERWAGRFDQATGFVTRSLLVVPLPVGEEIIGCLQLVNKQGGQLFHSRDLETCRLLADHAAPVLKNSRRFETYRTFLTSVIKGLVAAVEGRDPWGRGHAARVSRYAALLAERLGLPTAEVEVVEWAGLLHDIGKIVIPERVLRQAGPLDQTAWTWLKKHPTAGAQIVYQMEPKFLARRLWTGVLYHHEKWDGSGYPTGLKGEDIPLIARILALADAYDALTSERPYRPARTREEALTELENGRGTHFAPDLVDPFVALIRELEGV